MSKKVTEPEDWTNKYAPGYCMGGQSHFQRASLLVDRDISSEGIEVSAVERNKRVLAVEYKLRNGEPEATIDTRATLTTMQFQTPQTNTESPASSRDVTKEKSNDH